MRSLHVSVKIRNSACPVTFRHTYSKQICLVEILLYLWLIIALLFTTFKKLGDKLYCNFDAGFVANIDNPAKWKGIFHYLLRWAKDLETLMVAGITYLKCVPLPKTRFSLAWVKTRHKMKSWEQVYFHENHTYLIWKHWRKTTMASPVVHWWSSQLFRISTKHIFSMLKCFWSK